MALLSLLTVGGVVLGMLGLSFYVLAQGGHEDGEGDEGIAAAPDAERGYGRAPQRLLEGEFTDMEPVNARSFDQPSWPVNTDMPSDGIG